MSIWIRYLVAGLLAGFSLNILAADIAPLQQRWAEIQYQLPEDQKADAFIAGPLVRVSAKYLHSVSGRTADPVNQYRKHYFTE